MASHSDSIPKHSGFTLIEILISIGILAVVAGLGLFVSFDVYRHSSFISDERILISVLQKARNQSLNNINQVRHGVHFATSPQSFVIFECPSGTPQCTTYTSNPTTDQVIATSRDLIFPYGVPSDVIFNQLSGDTTAQTIVLESQGTQHSITINSEGSINW
jgi:prepilin-type N-terminal cleavage/methylation domain-containing protein